MNTKKNEPKKASEKKTGSTTKTTSKKIKNTSVAENISRTSITNEHIISKTKGAKMVNDFLEVVSKNKMPFLINKCYDFNKEIFDLILSDVNTTGIRIYFGINDENTLSIVFTGIDSMKDDVYIPLDSSLEELLKEKLGVADMGQVCLPSLYGQTQRTHIQLP